ncbi:MAG: hypothetical protein KAQ99_00795 [Candidatus Aureabacteria bacterium]|nr:hypothetical protein [Candidatus Auribacterota bacterium]
MSRFLLGIERATKAIHEALMIAGHNDAAEFVRVKFIEGIEEENIDWTLKEIFGLSKRELEQNKARH